MITRKISAALVIINYLLHFVKAIICLPYEIKAFGKSGNENYEIFKPLYDSPSLDVFNSIIDIFGSIGLLAMLTFLFTFLFEKNTKNQIINDVNTSTNIENNANPNDQPSAGLNILSFLIPLVGLIIYLTERDRSPRKATSAGKAALWGVGISVILSMISFFVAFALISSVG